jgi:NAD-dependent deacetylase
VTQAAIDEACERLSSAARPVSFSGAGLSAESGIATFRDKQGLWSTFDPMRLASPEGFAEAPDTVIEWYDWRRRKLAEARPNPAHDALAAWPGMTNVTQNVDDLLERAGATGVVHLHGRLDLDRCNDRCGHEEPVRLADPPGRRTCPRCAAPLRPGVVWFGESLPADDWATAEQACIDADTLLVVGTSAAVYPAAGLIGLARSTGATIIVVNPESSGASSLADIEIVGKAGEVLPQLIP